MNKTNENNNEMQHRIFRADTKLSSQEINELLGIRVTLTKLPDADLQNIVFRENTKRMFVFSLITLAITSVALLGSMYQLKVGPFYKSEAIASTR